MARYIDADAFYEKLNDLSKYHEGVYNGAINDCMNLLDNEPTAYDVEAVVEKVRCDCYTMGLDESQAEILVDDIRNGGKE